MPTPPNLTMSALNSERDQAEAAAAVSVGMTEGRGRGLFASAAMKAGATILVERPLVAMQSLDNAQDVAVCRNCLGFVGDVISQLELLSGLPRHECLQRHKKRRHDGSKSDHNNDDDILETSKNAPAHQLSGLFECLQGCGEVYCSPYCRSQHFDRSHGLLCVGPVPEEGAQDHPLVAFRVHAMQTNEIFLLAGEVMAQIVTAFSKNTSLKSVGITGNDTSNSKLAAARAPFADFVQEPWWDVAVPRKGHNEHGGSSKSADDEEDAAAASDRAAAINSPSTIEAAALPETLLTLCGESSALLRSAFALALGPLPASLESALTAEGFGRVVGMFEQNNMGVRAPSRIPDILQELLIEGKVEGGADGRNREGFLREVARLVDEVMAEGEECDDSDKDEVSSVNCGKGGGVDMRNGYCGAAAAADLDGCAEGEGSVQGLGETNLVAALGEEENLATGNGTIPAVLRRALDGEGAGEAFFPPLDGTALYSLVCCMNHSCRPNCIVHYPARRRQRGLAVTGSDTSGVARADPLVAEVVLLEDVSAGDELTQSYVARELGLVERREALNDYGFLCTCVLCLEEVAALP